MEKWGKVTNWIRSLLGDDFDDFEVPDAAQLEPDEAKESAIDLGDKESKPKL